MGRPWKYVINHKTWFIYFAVDWSQPLSWVRPQVQELEGDMKPLKDGLQSLTSQKDALLAEKTALKNEVCVTN